jgi:hypothetical protein
MFLRLITEHYHITRHSASVSEHFMQLKRVQLSSSDISPRQRILSIYFLVMIPYAMRKLRLDHAASSTRMALQQQPPSLRERIEQHIRTAILATEPLVSLICLLLYAAKGSGPFQAHHWLLGIQYLRVSDASSATGGSSVPPSGSPSRFSQIFSSISQVFGSPWLLTLFALRLTEWWFGAASRPVSNIVVPPPPPPQQFLCRPNGPGLCCVCFKRAPVGSLAVLCTGAVGCYSCIAAAAQRGVCPSTGAQLQNDTVRRVYEQ